MKTEQSPTEETGVFDGFKSVAQRATFNSRDCDYEI
jgi:hypothetical protein